MSKEVLIVDDSATVRKFVSVSLSMQGFTVVTACDGMDALEKISKGKFSLVITDLNMPTMDGLEFIKALRENPEFHEPARDHSHVVDGPGDQGAGSEARRRFVSR